MGSKFVKINFHIKRKPDNDVKLISVKIKLSDFL